eukprot:g11683.t1
MGFPFNGAENAVIPGQLPENIRNVFGPLTFPNGGLFRLCYSPDGVQWQELEPSISVFGAESKENKIWCPVTSLRRAECKTTTPTPIGCECTGKVQGYKRNNMTDEFMLTGLPNPAYPPWRSSLTYVNEVCGGGQDAAPFVDKVSNVQNEIGYEAPGEAVWKVCYCAGFDYDNGAGDGAPDSVSGGCSTSNSARYKIIRSSSESFKPYYDPDAGCRFLPQASTVRDGAQVLGGHLGPLNCEGPSTCYDTPEEVMGGKAPTFLDVQVDASYENRVMIAATYDICYCDENCLNSARNEHFLKSSVCKPSGRLLVFLGFGTDFSPVQGSWTGGVETKNREMKLLRDDDGNVDKESCLNTPQPLGISGHRLVSGNTDYTEPQTILEAEDPGRPRGQLYGLVHRGNTLLGGIGRGWKILIPVRFAAAEFPNIPNIPSVGWSQTSKETFQNIKVEDGAESPEGRGYIVCWCSECGLADADFQSYVGQAGQITVKRPNAMPEAYLGLTTVMPDQTPNQGNPGGPVAIAFVTGDLAHYATATGQQHLVFEILPGLSGASVRLHVFW